MTEFDQRGQTVETQYNADTINIGGTFEQYKAHLDEKEREIRALLVSAALSEKEKNDYIIELAKVEHLRLDERASYESHVEELKERIERLDQLVGQIPDKLILEAKQALVDGDNDKADQLFTQVEEQADPYIAAAAEAAFQRGKLAEDDIKYNQALQHYVRATQLIPNDTDYLNSAGIMSDALGEYDKAIEYYELALASNLKTFGEDHPNIKILAENLAQAKIKFYNSDNLL